MSTAEKIGAAVVGVLAAAAATVAGVFWWRKKDAAKGTGFDVEAAQVVFETLGGAEGSRAPTNGRSPGGAFDEGARVPAVPLLPLKDLYLYTSQEKPALTWNALSRVLPTEHVRVVVSGTVTVDPQGGPDTGGCWGFYVSREYDDAQPITPTQFQARDCEGSAPVLYTRAPGPPGGDFGDYNISPWSAENENWHAPVQTFDVLEGNESAGIRLTRAAPPGGSARWVLQLRLPRGLNPKNVRIKGTYDVEPV